MINDTHWHFVKHTLAHSQETGLTFHLCEAAKEIPCDRCQRTIKEGELFTLHRKKKTIRRGDIKVYPVCQTCIPFNVVTPSTSDVELNHDEIVRQINIYLETHSGE